MVVDFIDVSFLASVGLRFIIQSAMALDLNRASMAPLVGDHPLVRRTPEAVSIAAIMPTCSDQNAALGLSLIHI